jgi:ribose/xylose/arabinose/galactoside ABC-type transport system permease subunit
MITETPKIAAPIRPTTAIYLRKNRRPLSALLIFLALLVVFIAASPRVFLNPTLYTSVFTSLPIAIILVVPLVFIVASGEIDLSFPSIIGLSAWGFAACARTDLGPFLGLVAAIAIGTLAGFVNGVLVTKVGLSALVSTLGMNFLLRGLIQIGTQGQGIPLTFLRDTPFYQLFVGRVPVGNAMFPIQMVWGLAFAAVGWWLFNRHQFGAHTCCIGDNAESAREMGIDVDRTKIMSFVYVGIACAFAGVLSTLINNTFWPTTGDGYLLSALAAVFVGGTPTWGGVATVAGAVIGVFIVGFIETGLIAAGLTGFYTQFFYGLVLILSLITHRFNQQKRR